MGVREIPDRGTRVSGIDAAGLESTVESLESRASTGRILCVWHARQGSWDLTARLRHQSDVDSVLAVISRCMRSSADH